MGISGPSGRDIKQGDNSTQQPGMWDAFRTGLKLLIPLIITLFVLGFATRFLFNALSPAISAASVASQGFFPHIVLEVLVVVILVGIILGVGYISEFRGGRDEPTRIQRFDKLMASLPGVGAVYSSSRKAGDILIDNNTDSFREVKMVEYPHEGTFAIGFLTDDAPTTIARATLGDGDRDSMQSVFVPFSPNPFMGGVLLYVTNDRLCDVDMSVKEAVTAVMTSGVTNGNDDETVESPAEVGGFDPTDMD